jgi:23S rRNA G2445 N2-methylase RlmL
MKRLQRNPFLFFQLALLTMPFAGTFLLMACSKDDSPVADPACGSGKTACDEKAQICRDQATGSPIPSSCCGH